MFQPKVYGKLQRGIHTVVRALRPTLGPLSGGVVIDHINTGNNLPEFLDGGGTIARRIIELGNRDEDMGAMLARAMVVKQYGAVGDGTVTAAILLDELVSSGVRYIAAGGDAMQLRRLLEKLIPSVLEELDRLSFQLEGEDALINMAYSLCHDRDMAQLMGETFALLGQYGRLEVREGYGRVLRREYVQGTYYYSGALSSAFFPNGSKTRFDVEEPSIFLCDYSIDDHRELFPVLKAAHEAGVRHLIIIARDLSEKAVGLLTTNNSRMNTFTAIGIKLPGLNETDRMEAIEDLSLLTGTTPYLKVLGDGLGEVRAKDFGKARRVWLDVRTFGVIGGRSDKRRLREHIQMLKRQHQAAKDFEDRTRSQQRIGNLLGGSATLWIGGFSESEISATKSVVDRTVRAMRLALEGGVVAGGGIALLRCRDILEQRLKTITNTDERAVHRMLINALAAPARAIFSNAGYEPSEIIAKLYHESPEAGFDVETGQVVNICSSGIYDSRDVVKASVRNAMSMAALVLTIDVLVHRSNPELVGNPDE